MNELLGKPQKVTIEKWVEVDDDFAKESKIVVIKEFNVETTVNVSRVISKFINDAQNDKNIQYAINGLIAMIDGGKINSKYLTILPRILGSDLGKYLVELVAGLIGMPYDELKEYPTKDVIKLVKAMVEVNGRKGIIQMVKKSLGLQ